MSGGISLGEAVLALTADGKGLTDSINQTGPGVLSALDGLGKAGGALLAAGFMVAATAITTITGMIWDAGMTMDAAYDNIQIKTGATGVELKTLSADLDAVFGRIPTTAADASDVISMLNSRLHITGQGLRNIAVPLLEMSRLTGTDAAENARLYTEMMGDWSIKAENGAAALDMLYVASQKTGTPVGQLMQQVKQFGEPLRAVGYTLQESAALFGSWGAAGVNAELVAGSVRIAIGHFAKDNIPLQEGLQGTIVKIKEMTDSSAAVALGMEVFGAKAGPDMVGAIRSGRFSIEGMVASLGDAHGAIMLTAAATGDWGETWQVFQNKMTVALGPAGLQLMDGAAQALDTLIGVVKRPEIQAGMMSIVNGIVSVAQAAANNLPIVIDGIFKFVDFLSKNQGVVVAAFAIIGAALASFAAVAAVAMWAIIAPALPVIAVILLIAAAAYLLYMAWTTNFGGIQQIVARLWATIQPVFAQLVAWLQGVLPGAIATLVSWVQGYLVWAFNNLMAIIRFLIPIFTALAQWLAVAIPAAVNVLVAIWTGVLLPAIVVVWGFIQNQLWPLLVRLGTLMGAQLTLAVAALGALWRGVLLPALMVVWSFIQTNILPIFQELQNNFQNNTMPILRIVADFLGGAIVWAFKGIADIVQTVIGLIGELTAAFDSIKLPPALTPGSPTPFENGLVGIGNALDSLSSKSLPTFNAKLQLSTAGTVPVALSGAGAGAGAGGAMLGGQSATNFYGPVTFEVKDAAGFDEILRKLKKS